VEAALEEAAGVGGLGQPGQSPALDDAAGPLHRILQEHLSHQTSLKGLKLVVDGGARRGLQIAPDVFHELGAEVVAHRLRPDGLNINQGVGATHPQALVEAVKAARRRLRRGAGRRRRPPADGGRHRPPVQRRRTAVPDGRRPHGARHRCARRGGHAHDQHGGGSGLEGQRACSLCAPRWATATCWKNWSATTGRWAARARAPAGAGPHTTGDGLVSALQVLQCLRGQRPPWPSCCEVSCFPNPHQCAPATRAGLESQHLPGQEPARWKPSWATAAGC
jgi:phosphoglucosamine mutase